ncbi:MAG: tetratricopeptide repeat protein [Nitrospiraceae bacterium]|nr:tetratricopeptide repeat protein [Nitrospiraceae bacterium]
MKVLVADISFLFLFLFFVTGTALGQNIGKISQNHIPKSKIQVTRELVSPSWQLVWDRARKMVEKNRLEGAIALYKELLKERQGLIEARWELALLLIQTDRENLAIVELEDIIEARPHDLQALFILTGLLSNSGQCDRAVSTYNRLRIELNRRGKENNNVKNGLGDIPEGISLTRLQGDLAVCLESKKKYDKSIYYLRKVLSLEPHHRDLEFMLARELLCTKRAKASLPYFTDLLPQHADDADFLFYYAKALLTVGNRDKAMKVLARIVVLSNKDKASWAINELIRLHLMDGDIQAAIDLLEEELRDHPAILNRQLLTTLGRLYFASRRYLKSIQTFKVLVKEEPNDIEGLMFMARAYESLQLFTPAISIYGKVSLLRPNRDTFLHLLRLLLESGDFNGAGIIITRDLHGLVGSNILERRSLLMSYLENGDRKGIKGVLNRGSGLFKDPDILASYVAFDTVAGYLNARIRWHFYDEAILRLAEQGEGERTLLQAGIRLLLNFGQRDMAKEVLIRSWAEGRSLWSIETLASLCLKENNPGEAISWLEEALAVYPTSARLKLYESHLLLDMGRVTEAEGILSTIYIDNNWRWGREKKTLCAGHAASLEGRYEEALRLYKEIIQRSPDHLEAHRGRWITLAAYGLWQEASLEAQDLAIIIGSPPRPQVGIGNSYIDNRLIPMLARDGKYIPAPGAYLDRSIPAEELPPPKEVINSPFCKIQGEACPLLLALSYEQSGDFPEAIAMWSSFLKRHRLYWPGYKRVIQIYQKMGKHKSAEKVRHMACDRIKHLESASTSSYLDALESWGMAFCSN